MLRQLLPAADMPWYAPRAAFALPFRSRTHGPAVCAGGAGCWRAPHPQHHSCQRSRRRCNRACDCSEAGDDGGLLVLPDAFTIATRATTIALATKYRVPAIYTSRFWVAEGGLMSYGPGQQVPYRDGAGYVDRILRGAKPADLPVQLATKYELVLNLKTANALGLPVPPTLIAFADEVIE
jgi:ABC transporter substrate binding protein